MGQLMIFPPEKAIQVIMQKSLTLVAPTTALRLPSVDIMEAGHQ